jgi:hypothetical protein
MKRLLVALGVVGLLAIPRSAQAAQAITITPTSIDKTILPGQTISGQTQVLNQADSPFDFKVYAAPYSVTGEEYDPSFTPIPGATEVTDWIQLKAAKSRLEPFSVSSLDYRIAVPADAKPGGYYAVIFAETESKIEGSGVTTQKRVGTVVYIKVAGDTVERGRVITWEVPWLQKPNMIQTLRIENSGSSHFAATIRTTVKDLFGSTKLSYAQKRNVLPEKIRRVDIIWEKTPPLGIFKVDGSVEILGNTTQLDSKYVFIVSQPIRRGIMVAVGVITVLILGRHVYKRRKAKRAKHKEKEEANNDSTS